jgi:hypothetical protein
MADAAVANFDEEHLDQFSALYWIGAGLLWLGYVVVLMGTAERSFVVAVTEAIANVAPPAILGMLAPMGLRATETWSASARVWACLGAALAFMAACCIALPITLALAAAFRGEGFALAWFEGPALIWQGFQALLLFAVIALASLAHVFATQVSAQNKELVALRARVSQSPLLVDAPPEYASTLLVRTAEGLRSVSVAEIAAIEADDDAAILHLRNGTLRTRGNFASLGKQLDPSSFVRVHRSWIINLPQALGIEPTGGGRMVAFMPGGLEAPISRAGAKLVRSRQV